MTSKNRRQPIPKPAPKSEYECELCLAEGQKKEANHFCKSCNSYICDSCKESHSKFQELRRHTVISNNEMHQSSQPSDISDDLSHMSTEPSEEQAETRSKPEVHTQEKDVSTKPSESTATLFTKPTDSTQNKDKEDAVKRADDVNIKLPEDKTTPYIKGCCFMPGGELVVCDSYNISIKLLDSSLKFQGSMRLPGSPWDVTVLDNDNVIITMPARKEILFIKVLPTLQEGRKISVDKACYGVAVTGNQIYVSCYSSSYEGEVRIYDVNWTLKKKIGVNRDGSYMFKCPKYVGIGKKGDKMFVSDLSTNIITCLTTDGKLLYQFKNDKIKQPHWLYVDDWNNVITCVWERNIVEIIAANGKMHETLLSSNDGIKDPWCVAYRSSDRTLVVGCRQNNHLMVYKIW